MPPRPARPPKPAPARPRVDCDDLAFGGDVVRYLVVHEAEPVRIAELTEAERDVVARILRGLSNAEIAQARGSSVRTVVNQVASAFRKLGVRSRHELVRAVSGTARR